MVMGWKFDWRGFKSEWENEGKKRQSQSNLATEF